MLVAFRLSNNSGVDVLHLCSLYTQCSMFFLCSYDTAIGKETEITNTDCANSPSQWQLGETFQYTKITWPKAHFQPIGHCL